MLRDHQKSRSHKSLHSIVFVEGHHHDGILRTDGNTDHLFLAVDPSPFDPLEVCRRTAEVASLVEKTAVVEVYSS